MSKAPLPYAAADISQLAKSLRAQLQALERTPGHVEMLNALARAAGFRNFQHLRAQHRALHALQTPPAPAPDLNLHLVRRLLRFFDARGRLVRWPKKHSERVVCLWVLWTRLPARTPLDERRISDLLDTLHLFGDHALLRRELVDQGMVRRTPDGRAYTRLERRPQPEALAVLDALRERAGAPDAPDAP
jgi:hypothetical protein